MSEPIRLGGVFIRTEEHHQLRDFYARAFGLEFEGWGGQAFPFRELDSDDLSYSIFAIADSEQLYVVPGDHKIILNLNVEDLDLALARAGEAGASVLADRLDVDQGRFGYVLDPEGTLVELWEPSRNDPEIAKIRGMNFTAAARQDAPSYFEGMAPTDAWQFASAWLPAWSGNDPERLVNFYTPDAFYRDGAVPAGITGRDALLGYFTKLLSAYPDWVWTQRRADPMLNGFVNHWHAVVPVVGDEPVEIDGVCLVEMRDGLICRNEVFFDLSALPGRPRAAADESP